MAPSSSHKSGKDATSGANAYPEAVTPEPTGGRRKKARINYNEKVLEAQAASLEANTQGNEEQPVNDRKPTPEEKFQMEKAGPVPVLEIKIGDKVCKYFDDPGAWYEGKVTEGPHEYGWTVLYEDNDSETLTTEQVAGILGTKKDRETVATPAKLSHRKYEDAQQWLCYRVGLAKEEVVAALDEMEPPYVLNLAVQKIHEARNKAEYKEVVPMGKFKPDVGMRVIRYEAGAAYHGEVVGKGERKKDGYTGKSILFWPVKWDSGGPLEDMTFEELLESHADRPTRSHPVRGRELCALELFCGCGIVTQEFARLKFKVRSVDCDVHSNATDVVDILKLKYNNIGSVPDFIWASPPCHLVSLLSNGTHNIPSQGLYELTEEAGEHAKWLCQLFAILRWAREYHPHLIIIIENPVCLLQSMPIMIEMEQELGLHKSKVDYCAFGKDHKKPTHLWTNDYGLYSRLNMYRCATSTCPFSDCGHPVGVRGNTGKFNAAPIPLALAEEVADYVLAKFTMNDIRKTKKHILTETEIEDFNKLMAGSASIV